MENDRTEGKRRPPAGCFDEDDDEGQILIIEGVTYRYTNGGLVEIARDPKALTQEQRAALDAEMDEAFKEVNPHGNPYRDGLA